MSTKNELIKKANKLNKDAQNTIKAYTEAMNLFNALTTNFDNSTNNAKLFAFLNQEIDAKLVNMSVSQTVKDKFAVANVVYTFNINGQNIDYTILRAIVKNNKETNVPEFKEYNMYRYFTNKLHTAAETANGNDLIGKSFKLLVQKNANGYVEIEVLGLA